jgi:hypothetical protein
MQLNDETFKQMKHHVQGWIGQPQETKNPITNFAQHEIWHDQYFSILQ